jgi:hypothetical protein
LEGSTEIGKEIGKIIGNAIGMGIEGVLQAAFWVTIGFVIYERFGDGQYGGKQSGDNQYEGKQYGGKDKQWSVKDLPDLPVKAEVNISRSSSIAGIILSVFFPVLLILMITRDKWVFFLVRGAEVINPFSQAALDRFIPFLILFGALGVFINLLKLIWGRWNIRLCIANIIQNVIWLSAVLYILSWPDLFSAEFKGFAYSLFENDGGATGFLYSGGLVIFFAIIFIAAAALDIGMSTWNTVKGRKELKKSAQ